MAPPVPSPCDGLQSDLDRLRREAKALRDDAPNWVGRVAWTKLAALATTLLQFRRTQLELERCIEANSGPLVCALEVIDAGGGGAGVERRAELWDLTAAQPVLVETAPAHSGGFSFKTTSPPSRLGVVISATDTATATGPDFRSEAVALASLGAGTAPRVEVVLGPAIAVSADELSRWFTAAVAPTSPGEIAVSGVGRVSVKLDAVAVALAPPNMRVMGLGTATGQVALLGAVDSPLSVTLTLGLVPTTVPAVTSPAMLTFAAAPQVEISGRLASFGSVLNIALAGFLGDWLLNVMRPIVDRELTAAAASALALSELPSSVTLSIRRLSIGANQLTIQPALGAPGTTLSTYTPPTAQILAVPAP